MSKRTDRLFHLSVTLFAIALTGASATALVYQHHPQILQSFVQLVTPGQPSGETQKLSTDGQNPNGSNQRAAGHGATIQVHAFGSLVSPKVVENIGQATNEQHIVANVSNRLGLSLSSDAVLYIVQNATDYKRALASQGLSMEEAQTFSHDTGGFTNGNVILIPLNQNQTEADLVNTIAHELTHVILNQNVPNIPSWLNEGLAVYNGMSVQRQAQNQVVFSGYARRMAESVVSASLTNRLVPLLDDESGVLKGGATYNVELQDWLAVSDLLRQKGKASFEQYFANLQRGVLPQGAFVNAFGMSEGDFNQAFTNQLKGTGIAVDNGVDLSFVFPAHFDGSIRFLQHDTRTWRSLTVTSGEQTIQVDSHGRLSGVQSPVQDIPDAGNPDTSTLFVNVQPGPLAKVGGQRVMDGGFAIDYHNGLYGFVDTWTTFGSGKTQYSHDPTLFGITLVHVTESHGTNALALNDGSATNKRGAINPLESWLDFLAEG